MKQITRVYYGSQMILRTICPACNKESFLLDGLTACCKVDLELEDIDKAKKKRESLSPYKRNFPPLKIRKGILAHQNYQCIYCGINLRRKRVRAEYDHFIPFSATGESKYLHTFVASCKECNQIKGALIFNSIEEARIYIYAQRRKKNLPIFNYYGGTFDVIKI